jgi:hypothetical protein
LATVHRGLPAICHRIASAVAVGMDDDPAVIFTDKGVPVVLTTVPPSTALFEFWGRSGVTWAGSNSSQYARHTVYINLGDGSFVALDPSVPRPPTVTRPEVHTASVTRLSLTCASDIDRYCLHELVNGGRLTLLGRFLTRWVMQNGHPSRLDGLVAQDFIMVVAMAISGIHAGDAVTIAELPPFQYPRLL